MTYIISTVNTSTKLTSVHWPLERGWARGSRLGLDSSPKNGQWDRRENLAIMYGLHLIKKYNMKRTTYTNYMIFFLCNSSNLFRPEVYKIQNYSKTGPKPPENIYNQSVQIQNNSFFLIQYYYLIKLWSSSDTLLNLLASFARGFENMFSLGLGFFLPSKF